MKKILLVVFILSSGISYADAQLTAKAAEIVVEQHESQETNYIDREAYIQNPYMAMPSGGDTLHVEESQLATQNVAEKWFSDGTWNVFGASSYVNQNGFNNYGYGANIFAQTGEVAGFSFGGLMTIMNPFYSDKINPSDVNGQAQTLPIAYQVTPQELFAEYQYNHIVQVDAGYIGISNSPWMTYYQNNALNLVTYQGAMINVNPGGGWLLTGFAINGAQLLGENGFSQQTMYNYGFDYGTGTANISNTPSVGTVAVGASWTSPDTQINARLWGYQFYDYANMLYADTTLEFPLHDNMGFTLGFQGALQGGNEAGNILNNNGYGNNVQSTMLGVQLNYNYSILGVQLAYNNIWGPQNAYEGGGLVSPYTYQIATDPLYTTGWMQGLVEKSAGQAYKLATNLDLFNNKLIIVSPSVQYYATTMLPASTEYDLQVSYSVSQVKGLTFFAGYGYTVQPSYTDTFGNDLGGNFYQGQVMVSYLY